MFLVKGLLHLLVHIISIPFHLVFTLIKYIIITPLVLIMMIAFMLLGCALIAVPGAISSIDVASIRLPDFVTTITSQIQGMTTPASREAASVITQVTCVVHSKSIVVQWSVNHGSTEIKGYKVMRKSVRETVWQSKSALAPSRNSNGAATYEYTDTTATRGATYQYGITVLKVDGSEGEMVVSPVQVVAP